MQNVATETTPWQVTDPEIMDLDKYLSSANAPDLEEDARLCIESGARDMIFNCAPLSYLTGAGLRSLLNIARMMSDVGGRVGVQGLAGQPREIFYACGLEAFMPCMDQSPSLLSSKVG
jgi:anti-anti-sigma factor